MNPLTTGAASPDQRQNPKREKRSKNGLNINKKAKYSSEFLNVRPKKTWNNKNIQASF